MRVVNQSGVMHARTQTRTQMHCKKNPSASGHHRGRKEGKRTLIVQRIPDTEYGQDSQDVGRSRGIVAVGKARLETGLGRGVALGQLGVEFYEGTKALTAAARLVTY